MIQGMHLTYFTPQAQQLRAFFRDKLGIPFHDVGDGWLIFDLPMAEIGCHPVSEEELRLLGEGKPVDPSLYPEVSFYCDDIYATVAQLQARGVEFSAEIVTTEYGLSTHFRLPGDLEMELYQPLHERPQP